MTLKIDDTMEDWKEDKLINLLDSLIDYRGKTPNKKECGVPLITAKIIKNGRIEKPTEFIAFEDYDSWMVRGFPQKGDVVLTTEAPLGEVAQLDNRKIALAQRTVCLRGKHNVLDNTYLKYYFMSSLGHSRLCARETGTTVVGIKQSQLKEVLVSYPSFNSQQKIASVLSSLDDKIELNKRINDNLEQQAQALFKSWFVDFEPFKDGKFVDSELGMIPEGWKVCAASDIFDINIGKTPPRKEQEWFSTEKNQNVTWVSISDMGNNGMFISDSSEYLTKEAVSKFNIIIVPNNTILLSFKLTIGRVAICNSELTTNEAIARFYLPNDSFREYLYLALKDYDYTKLGSTSSIATAVNSKIIKNMLMLSPGNKVIQKFSSLVNPLFETIKLHQDEICNLSLERDTLLQKLMSGELKINDLNN